MGRLIARHANLNVTLKFANEQIDPLRDDFDLAIQTAEPLATYLVRTRLTTADLKLYAAPQIANSIFCASDLKKHKAIKTSNEAADELLLRLNDGHRTWEERLRVACTVNDPEAAC